MKKIIIDIIYQNTKRKNIYVPFIKKMVNIIINYLLSNKIINKKTLDEKNQLDILICDNKKIRELNKQYRNIDKPTNELSFSYIDDNSPYIGEIVINWDEVIRDSDKTFIDRKKSILNFLTHAILHIFGYTHDTPKKEREMENLKNKIIHYVLDHE